MSWYLTRSVTLVRRELTGQDSRGNDVFADVEVTVDGCSWDERSSMGSENVDARQQVVSGRNLYCADPLVDIRSTDAVVFPDRPGRYEVDGEIGRWTGSLMGTDHAAVALRRVTG